MNVMDGVVADGPPRRMSGRQKCVTYIKKSPPIRISMRSQILRQNSAFPRRQRGFRRAHNKRSCIIKPKKKNAITLIDPPARSLTLGVRIVSAFRLFLVSAFHVRLSMAMPALSAAAMVSSRSSSTVLPASMTIMRAPCRTRLAMVAGPTVGTSKRMS